MTASCEEAFAGARALIDRVKAEAPIWKREITPEGVRRVPGTLPRPDDEPVSREAHRPLDEALPVQRPR